MQIDTANQMVITVQNSPWALLPIIIFSALARWIINIFAHHIPDKMIFEWHQEIANERQETFVSDPPSLKKSAQETPFWPRISLKNDIIQSLTDLISVFAPAVLIYATERFDAQIAAMIALIWLSCLAMIIDKRHMLLPDVVTQPALWLGLIASICGLTITPEEAILGAIAGYAFIYVFSKLFNFATGNEGIGMGDAKWLAVCGAWFGANSITFIIITAAIFGVIHSALSKQKEFALGPMLCTATVLMCFRQLVF